MPTREEALTREALRVFHRYQFEIVEDLNLCPWAERARLEGQVSERVIPGKVLTVEPALVAIREFFLTPRLEIGILIFPEAETDYSALGRFASLLADADAARHALGSAPFALAAFHPDAPCDDRSPERLVPFLRRTPDPTIQLVRRSALDRVREGFTDGTQFIDLQSLPLMKFPAPEDTTSLRERIARANQRTVKRVGLAAVEAKLREIRDDRDRAYRAIGRPEERTE